jgi:hypothetical protein
MNNNPMCNRMLINVLALGETEIYIDNIFSSIFPIESSIQIKYL